MPTHLSRCPHRHKFQVILHGKVLRGFNSSPRVAAKHKTQRCWWKWKVMLNFFPNFLPALDMQQGKKTTKKPKHTHTKKTPTKKTLQK